MQYKTMYTSPLGKIVLACDEQGLLGAWFENQKYFASRLNNDAAEQMTPVLQDACAWLEAYFEGKNPAMNVPLHFIGSPFQTAVWNELLTIPYGTVTTYKELGDRIAAKLGKQHMSPQAIGGAVGHNPLSLFVPCHRVVSANGSLTGYAGGIDRKAALLKLEHVPMDNLFLPTKGTAL